MLLHLTAKWTSLGLADCIVLSVVLFGVKELYFNLNPIEYLWDELEWRL